jgi:hypothetical protein
VKPVIDGKLLIKCPDIQVWANGADDIAMGTSIITMGSQYKDCQSKDSVLVDRVQEMMKK